MNGAVESAEEFFERAPISRDNALTCPSCGTPTNVVDSRPKVMHGFTTTWRRRACSGCDMRFNTLEVRMEYFETAVSVLSRLARIKNPIENRVYSANEFPEDNHRIKD